MRWAKVIWGDIGRPDRLAAEWSAGERVFLEDHVQELVAEATSD